MNSFNNMNHMNNMMMQTPQRGQMPYYNSTIGTTDMSPTNNIIWVQGIEGAKAWQMNPNSRAILLDSELEGKMYIKVCDNIGISSLRIFNFVEEFPANNTVTANNVANIDLSQYVKKEELQQIVKELLNEQSISTDNSKESSKPSGVTIPAPGF